MGEKTFYGRREWEKFYATFFFVGEFLRNIFQSFLADINIDKDNFCKTVIRKDIILDKLFIDMILIPM